MIAKLSHSSGVEWAVASGSSGHESTRPVPSKSGSLLRPGEYHLKRGRVWMTFNDGALVGVTAPAVFTLENARRMQLSRGKLMGYCTGDARGFEV